MKVALSSEDAQAQAQGLQEQWLATVTLYRALGASDYRKNMLYPNKFMRKLL